MSEQTGHRVAPEQPQPSKATAPATPEACARDYAEGAVERAAFDASARRRHGPGTV